MERIQPRRNRGINTSAIRLWGLLFVALGAVSMGLIQNRIMGMTTGTDLLALLEQSPDMMTYATMAVAMQAMETCAVPIFAFLLAEGMEHTTDPKKYLFRALILAAVSEIPYNLVMAGKLLDFSSRNPVFGVALALIAIWFCKTYGKKNLKNFLIRTVLVVCAMLWCGMLRIRFGGALVVIAWVLWVFRRKPAVYRLMAGATVTTLCSVGNMLFVVAPMGFLPILFYNGEKGDSERNVNYGAYPVILLLTLAAGYFLV